MQNKFKDINSPEEHLQLFRNLGSTYSGFVCEMFEGEPAYSLENLLLDLPADILLVRYDLSKIDVIEKNKLLKCTDILLEVDYYKSRTINGFFIIPFFRLFVKPLSGDKYWTESELLQLKKDCYREREEYFYVPNKKI